MRYATPFARANMVTGHEPARVRSGTGEKIESAARSLPASERRSKQRPLLHFRRIELKYFVPDRMLPHLRARLTPFTNVDPYLVKEGLGRISYPVSSLYFDTQDLKAFAEKEAGLFYRRKLRLRTYEHEFSAEQPCFLEIKRRLDSVVLKDRISFPARTLDSSIAMPRLLGHLLDNAKGAPDTINEAQLMRMWLNLQPSAFVRYDRLALVAKEDPSLRVTIDHNLAGLWNPAYVLGAMPYRSVGNINASGMDGVGGRYSILELKCDRAIPGWFHQIVRDLELTRSAYSKYFLVVASLRPQLKFDCGADFLPGGSP